MPCAVRLPLRLMRIPRPTDRDPIVFQHGLEHFQTGRHNQLLELGLRINEDIDQRKVPWRRGYRLATVRDCARLLLHGGSLLGGLHLGFVTGRIARPVKSRHLQISTARGTSPTVVAPMAATIYRAARGLDNGEIQYMFDFINACGVLYRLSHLRDLSPRFQQIAASLPPAVEGDSRTSPVAAGQNVAVGETIATTVGYRSGNFFFDWGVYDLRARNEASAEPAWLAQHPG